MIVGRVANSEPFCWSSGSVNGGGKPEDWPNEANMPERLQAVERGRKGVLADGIVDAVDALAAGDLLDPRDEILGPVVDDMGAAIGPGELGLLLVAHRPDHASRRAPTPTGVDQRPTPPAAACHRMVWPFSTLKVRRTRHWTVRPLRKAAAATLVVDAVGQLDGALGRQEPLLGIGADMHLVDDAVARPDMRHARRPPPRPRPPLPRPGTKGSRSAADRARSGSRHR